MKLDKDIQHVLKMRWRHFAGRDIPFDVSWTHLNGYLKLYRYFIGLRFKCVLIEGKGMNFIMWRDPADIARLRRALSKRIHSDAYLTSCTRRIITSFVRFRRSASRFIKLDVRAMSNEKLASELGRYHAAFQHTAEGVSTLVELINAYGDLLMRRHRGLNEQALTLLSTPKRDTTPLQEERNFFRLIKRIQARPKGVTSREGRKAMKKHFEKYRWTSVYLGGDPWRWSDFANRVRSTVRSENPDERLTKLKARHEMNEFNSRQLSKKFSLTQREVVMLREMIYYRIEHENAFSRITYSSTSLRAEAARRLRLSRDEYHRLKLEEVTAALRGEKLPLKKLSDSRSKHYVVVLGMKRCHVFAGKDADALMRRLPYAKIPKKKRSQSSTRVVTGICGSQGSAQGTVRIVSRIEDIGKLRQGEILVTQNTTPTFLPAMKKSAAVITDEGGITCHAAIVSRELGIPCVIGTKNATQVLKNGQKVNVDATRGIVKRV